MAIDSGRVKVLFQAAIEFDSATERQAFLERETGGDAELQGRLSDLLAVFDRPPNILERPLLAELAATAYCPRPPVLANIPDPILDTVIADRYKVRQKIGEGGMGGVYLAEQMRPVRRQVALKVIKPGMDSGSVLSRFESERQALAMMDHPHIARILDAGTTESGRPYFVMDLVKGIPLTEYCDQNSLDLPQRLNLFRQICSAVHHAHQKGIIHRDLKPTNILVENYDGIPSPRVIDFGLAKATSGTQLSEHSLFTAFGAVTGTPLYMAPEQATFNALDVDTRADVYALGVILYELLTGTTPIRRDSVKRAALDEMFRVIREEEPPTPSSRISTTSTRPASNGRRPIEQMRLSRLVKGDLDWIVMKALAKERDRRYDSAIDLASDVDRFLKYEPVTAGPPTAGYRIQKFVRRHRGRVVAVSMLLLALIGGVVGTTVGLFEAQRQEAIAIFEAGEKEQARQAEAEQRQQAEIRLRQVVKMNEILCAVFQDLDSNGTDKESRPLTSVLIERVDRAVEEIERQPLGDPVVVARMEMTLGKALRNLGQPQKSMSLLTKSFQTLSAQLGVQHPDTFKSLHNLALGYADTGQINRALQLYEEALPIYREKLGPSHSTTLKLLASMARVLKMAGTSEQADRLWISLFAVGELAGRTDDVLAWKADRAKLNAGAMARKSEVKE